MDSSTMGAGRLRESTYRVKALRLNGNITDDADYDVGETRSWILRYDGGNGTSGGNVTRRWW